MVSTSIFLPVTEAEAFLTATSIAHSQLLSHNYDVYPLYLPGMKHPSRPWLWSTHLADEPEDTTR